MKHLRNLVVYAVFAGCLPKNITPEDELAHARAEKAKHPEQWTKPKKLTPAKARAQEMKWLRKNREHDGKIIAIESEYRAH